MFQMSPKEVLRNIHTVLPEIKYIYRKRDGQWFVSRSKPDVGITNWVNYTELRVDLPMPPYHWEDSLETLDETQ